MISVRCALFFWTLALCPASAFSDVPPDHWCAGDIAAMEGAGVIRGYADGTFRPAAPVTAAQFVVMVSRCAGQDAAADSTENREPSAPLRSSHWAAAVCEDALAQGWYDWDELPPTGERYDAPITRQLAAKILMRALLPEVRGEWALSERIADFSALPGRYYEPILAAYGAGVLSGDGAGNFRPADGLTRAAACAVLSRALRAADGGQSAPANPSGQNAAQSGQDQSPAPDTVPAVRGGVTENGWLSVKGTQLCNERGEPILLRGFSSHGLQWYGQFTSETAIQNTAERGANLFRAAMYTGEGGYLSNPETMKQRATEAVDAAISCGLYVILDWHILSDGNPRTHQAEAVGFFSDMAARYGDSPAVLYEICNEPNGSVTWEGDIKPYAQAVIAAIREKAPKSVILVGSGTWSQDIHTAAASPLDGENIMYTLHFYAGTHGRELRERIDSVLAKGLPVFVSEWGTSRADGNGGVYLDAAAEWLDFLEARGISWCSWSLCDKGESSAALLPGTPPDRAWTEADFSPSGQFVFSRLGE